MLLHSLPSSFNNFCCAIKSRDKLPDIDALMIKIIEERDSKVHENIKADTNAMFSRQWSKTPRDGAINRQQSDGNSSNEARYKCHYCNKKDHKAADCFKKKREAKSVNTASDVFYANEISNISTSATYNHAMSQRWCLESGCTSHLCKDPKLFVRSCKAENYKLANQATARATVT